MAKNIPLLLYQSIFRWNLILGWLIVFLPYLFAMLADGMYQWKLKRYVFGKVTVQFYRIWFRAFWVISALTMVYLVMPNMSLFNNIAQLFPPVALLILGIALNRLWSNFQNSCKGGQMLSSKKRKSPTNIKESLNDNADRFYKMFRIHTTAKVAMSLIAMTAVGFSFYNLYEQWQDAEGKKDHIAVIRISGEMGTGSETGDGTVIATALAKAYNNPHAKAVIIEAESGGGGPSDAIIIYRQINALKNHQPQIERVSDAGGSLSSVAADKSNKTGSTERGDEARSKQNSLEVLSSGTGRFFSDIADSYKPIIVSVKGICASACYYAVSPADAIYADSNALIGSIGVRMDHWNLSEIMSTVGVKNEPLTAGEFKDALDPFHPLSDSTREFMQKEILNTMHEKFITDVELGRGKKLLSRHDADAVSLYSGRVWPTPQAVKYGLVDGDLTSVEIRTRLSKMYSTDTFKNYNEPHRNLRSALGMLMSLSSNIESLTGTTTRLVESVNATSYPSVR